MSEYTKNYRLRDHNRDHEVTVSWGSDTAPVVTCRHQLRTSSGRLSKPPKAGRIS